MKKVQIGNAKIEIIQGDIVKQEVDVIVNAGNNNFWMGSGVAGAIKKYGGEQIEREAIEKGPVEVGEVVVTEAGNLNFKKIIHSAVMGQDLITNEKIIKIATENSLKKADEMNMKSLAFPAFGTGVGKFNLYKCAEIMLNATIDFLLKSSSVKLVKFVLFSEKAYDIFLEELDTFFHKK
ncbi:MAG: macro domain-containing protein [Candidatus Marinimicrobia bacterium]|nr:macro domain-containing protein [Candidatus Neomarinimicrobiota bacterium]